VQATWSQGTSKPTLQVHDDEPCYQSSDTRTLQAQCLSNLTDVLKAAGSSWDKVVKVNIYLKSMGDYPAMNEEYIKACHDHSF
jgi:enamine deaminase RidA (YjgF/YER057c/UK114 family)